MVSLFALVGFCFAAIAAFLVGQGCVVLTDGHSAAGTLEFCIGLFVSYGAYLFTRAAWRTHRDSTRPRAGDNQAARRRMTRGYLLFGFAQAAFALALPNIVPGAVRVLSAVGAILVIPLLLAHEVEPPKRSKRR